MGVIQNIASSLLGHGRINAVDVIETFRVNAEADAARAAEHKAAALAQLAAEFDRPTRGWFHPLIDGLNRLPRPLMALGVIGLFVSAMISPEWFISRMRGLLYVPEPLWWLLGVIVSFYFGARFQAKEQEMLKSMVVGLQRDGLKAERAPQSAQEHRGFAAPQVVQDAPLEENPLENRALSAWKRLKSR